MNKTNWLLVLAMAWAPQAFAAKFTTITKMQHTGLEALSDVAAEVLKDEVILGDVFQVSAFSFTRRSTEKNLNTMKQLNIAKAGIWEDDGTSRVSERLATKIVDDFLTVYGTRNPSDALDDNQMAEFKRLRNRLVSALLNATQKLTDRKIEIYSAMHSDEDGTWAVLDLLDTETNEVLVLQVGANGT